MTRPNLTVGQRVRARREAPARGTWSRYDGKSGTIKEVRDVGTDTNPFWEIGVHLDDYAPTVWFLPEELELLRQRKDSH